jgi:hypothetical protein
MRQMRVEQLDPLSLRLAVPSIRRRDTATWTQCLERPRRHV